MYVQCICTCLLSSSRLLYCLGPLHATVVHRHGGEHAPQYDGHPDSWFTFRGDTGPTFSTNFYNYTNSQYPTMMWYGTAPPF